MRKIYLFFLMLLALPLVAMAAVENNAVTKTISSNYGNNGSQSDSRVIVDFTQSGCTYPMSVKNHGDGNTSAEVKLENAKQSYSVGFWFKSTAIYSNGNYSWSIPFRMGSYKECSMWGAYFISYHTDGTLTFHIGNDNSDNTGCESAFQNVSSGISAFKAGKASLGTADLNEWHYVLISHNNDVDAPETNVYVDGEKKATFNQCFGYAWGDPCFEFGGWGFSGAIDEVQLWNKSLTEDEAAKAMVNAKSVNDGLQALYTFNEGANGEFANEAGVNPDYKAYWNTASFGATYAYGLYGGPSSIPTTGSAATFVEGREVAYDVQLTVPAQVEGGSFVVTADGVELTEGVNTIQSNQMVKIVATPDNGWNLQSILVGGNEVENDTEFNVIEDSEIEVTFSNEVATLTIVNDGQIPWNLYRNNTNVTDQIASLVPGVEYTFSLTVPESKAIVAVKLNDTELTATNGTYKFTLAESSTLTVESRDKAQYTITIARPEGGTVTVIKGTATEIPTGSKVYEGTILTLQNTPNAGWQFVNYLVDGANYNGTTVTPTADVTISAVFEEGIDYCVPTPVSGHSYESTKKTNYSGRGINTLTVTDGTNSITVNGNGTTGMRDVYADHSDQKLVTEAGKTITITSAGAGEWMHTFIFADFDGNGFTMDDMAYTDGATGSKNYGGRTFTINVPATQPAGDYRFRYKVDWDEQDPCVYGQATKDNGEVVIDFTISIPRVTLDNPRTVTVASANEALGTVAITNPATDEATITTDEPTVRVVAYPVEGVEFLNWTDAAGRVVATTAGYNYTGEEDVELTANFGYAVSLATAGEGGTATFSYDGNTYNDYQVVLPGTEVTVNATADAGYKATVKVNNVQVALTGNTYTFAVNEKSDIVVSFVEQGGSISILVEGQGDVIVSSAGTAAAGPSGTFFSDGDEIAASGQALKVFAKPADGWKFAETNPLTYTRDSTAGAGSTNTYNFTTSVSAAGYEGYYFRALSAGMGEVIISVVFEEDQTQGIGEIGIDPANGPVEYYNLQGVRVAADNLTQGFYIMRQGTKTAKVMIQK